MKPIKDLSVLYRYNKQMNHIIITKTIVLLLGIATTLSGQGSWKGTYIGEFNGDRVNMELLRNGKSKLQGFIKDTYSEYEVNAVERKDTLRGKAVEKSLGVTFDVLATRKGNRINMVLSLDFFGTVQKIAIDFTKTSNDASKSGKTSTEDNGNPVASKTRDARIPGTWVKESNYSSGFGSNDTFGAISSQETMIFYQDGTLANGPSVTVVGGSNYSGSSASDQTNKIEGLYWYNQSNRLFLLSIQDGKEETVELGTYYVDESSLMITGTNGAKMILSRK